MFEFKRILNYFLLILNIVSISLLGLILIIFVSKLEYKHEENLTLNEWGDYIGGVWGTVISFLGLIATLVGSYFIFSTLKMQKSQILAQDKQLDLQRKQLKIQERQALDQTRTEYLNLVFNLLLKQFEKFDFEVEKLVFIDYQNKSFKGKEALSNFINHFSASEATAKELNIQLITIKENPIFASSWSFYKLTHDFREFLLSLFGSFEYIINDAMRNLEVKDKLFLLEMIKNGCDTLRLLAFIKRSCKLLEIDLEEGRKQSENIISETKLEAIEEYKKLNLIRLNKLKHLLLNIEKGNIID